MIEMCSFFLFILSCLLFLLIACESQETATEFQDETHSNTITFAMISKSQNLKSPNRKEHEVNLFDRIHRELSSAINQQPLIAEDVPIRSPGGLSVSYAASVEVVDKHSRQMSGRSELLHLATVFKGLLRRLPRAEPETSTSQQSSAAAAATADDGTSIDPTTDERSSSSGGIWEGHRWLFIAIIIFICLSILLTVICCICLKCCKTASAKRPVEAKEPEGEALVAFNPSGGLMKEQSPPNEPPPIDEENGWIIPLDQMTKEELEQPEVQVSRL